MDSVVAWMRDSVLSLNIPDNMQRIYNVETLYILVYLYETVSSEGGISVLCVLTQVFYTKNSFDWPTQAVV